MPKGSPDQHQHADIENRHHGCHDRVGEFEDAQHQEGDAEGDEPSLLGAEFRSRLRPETGRAALMAVSATLT
jgi:hypothetical protein